MNDWSVQSLRIGPVLRYPSLTPGDCPECGWQCAPECGKHPLGCVYGGMGEGHAYWLIADGCGLDHGEAGDAFTE